MNIGDRVIVIKGRYKNKTGIIYHILSFDMMYMIRFDVSEEIPGTTLATTIKPEWIKPLHPNYKMIVKALQ